ncbi:MAG: terpene cyclase/mutase family protein [Planctomycetes bacterium]|nr:terpene cyclase/mutase family protein [Planctomycetota bacterium]
MLNGRSQNTRARAMGLAPFLLGFLLLGGVQSAPTLPENELRAMVLAAQGEPSARPLPKPGPASLPSAPAAEDEAEVRRQTRAAVDRALRYLSRRQTEPDGSLSFAQESFSDGEPRGGEDRRAPFAVTALAALAYMADGNTEMHGPYSANLQAAIDYLLNKATFDTGRDGQEAAYLSADGDRLSRMHGHGYATLALAEVLGMSGALGGAAGGRARIERIRKTLAAAVRKIVASQGQLGGWYYEPRIDDSHEGSVTITLVQALRAARNAGIAVPAGTIHRAVDYVRKSQVDRGENVGAFRYQIGSDDVSVALTAAAISTLNATGDYDSEIIDRGMKYMMKQLERRDRGESSRRLQILSPAYELLYVAQALRQYRDPEAFPEWFRKARRTLLKTQQIRAVDGGQREEGSWGDPYGRMLSTAIGVLVLRMDDSYLPIFER